VAVDGCGGKEVGNGGVDVSMPVVDCSNGMCQVPAGTFQMGSTSGLLKEQPVHAVTLAAYEMDEFEVTVSQYAACVTAGGCTAADTGWGCDQGVANRDKHPINSISSEHSSFRSAWWMASTFS
jgi:formylglycine-generating enzyme required for sulfatase activity